MGSRVRVPYTPQHSNIGTLTEWLGSGLQNRVQQFESAGYLDKRASNYIVCSLSFRLTQTQTRYQLRKRNSGFANHRTMMIDKAAIRFCPMLTHCLWVTLCCHTQLRLLQVSPHKWIGHKMCWRILYYTLNLICHDWGRKLTAQQSEETWA